VRCPAFVAPGGPRGTLAASLAAGVSTHGIRLADHALRDVPDTGMSAPDVIYLFTMQLAQWFKDYANVLVALRYE